LIFKKQTKCKRRTQKARGCCAAEQAENGFVKRKHMVMIHEVITQTIREMNDEMVINEHRRNKQN